MNKRYDITGQKFGSLLVISHAGKNKWNTNEWNCLCDCGRKCIKNTGDIKRKNVSCGQCLYDITNQRFGKLTAIEVVEKTDHGEKIWKCKCDCGNYIELKGTILRDKNNTRRQCYNCKKKKEKNIDLINMQFGYISVINKNGNKLKKNKYIGDTIWLCRCICGNEKNIVGYELTSGSQKSCGCKRGHYKSSGIYKSKISNKVETYHSYWELLYMLVLDKNSFNWTKNHDIRIKYFHNKKEKIHIPDFLIKNANEKTVVEIKGRFHLSEKENIKRFATELELKKINIKYIYLNPSDFENVLLKEFGFKSRRCIDNLKKSDLFNESEIKTFDLIYSINNKI